MSRTRSLLLLAAATLAGLAGCARQSSLDVLQAQPAQEYRGHFTLGPDGSWFRPCGAPPADSAWWVTVTGAAAQQADSARRAGLLAEGRPSFVRWRAVLTRGGEIGPKGGTALLVREIVALRPAAANDCAE